MTGRRVLHAHDYSVAWVCALPIELAASRLMLDELHERPSELPHYDSHDQSEFTFGSINQHNLVIACLPLGTHGTVSAALAVQKLLLSFPRIRYGLLVGIGGGAPGIQADIRLGDVVVSTPSEGFSGVVPYESGKIGTGGQLRCIRALNKPPQVLLATLTKIEAAHRLDGSRVPSILHIVQQKSRYRVPTSYLSYPGQERDLLFQAMYEHQRSDAADCTKCDPARIVSRCPRLSMVPLVHYGLIASGDKVMRHARTRDEVARRHHILCFDMEAAGIMDLLPCLVIRGISDYADSHKNNTWQGYAAATAAAYAKELLSFTPLSQESIIRQALSKPRQRCNVSLRRNKFFTGRGHELDELAKRIATITTVTTVALTGLGGVGKTQIAIEAAQRARDRYPQLLICWISARSRETMETGWLSLCKTLDLPLDQGTGARELVCSKLGESHFGRWLLIIDNMDDMDIWMSEKCRLPVNGTGFILLTTRNRKIAVNAASSAVYSIPVMHLSDAETLLSRRLLDPIYDRPSVHQLLTKLNCLPLAITQAAAYINANGMTVAEYLSLLDDSDQSLLETLSEGVPAEGMYTGETNTVASTWDISFQNIHTSDSLAARYLSMISCLDARDIPLSALPTAPSLKALMDAIGTLSAYSFVSRTYIPTSSTGTPVPCLTVNPLIHAAMRNWLREAKALTPSTVKAIERLDNIFPEHDDHMRESQSQSFGSWRCYFPHVEYLMRTTTDNISMERVDLLEKYGLCLYTDGRYCDAEEPLHTIVQIMTKLFGRQDARTLNSMNNLALIYSNQSKLSTAETLQGRACRESNAVLGSGHSYYVNGINTLSTIYQRQGRWDDAEILARKVVEYRESNLGPESAHTLNSMENLACTYMEQGHWKEAEDTLRRVFDIRCRAQEGRDQNALRSMNNLAQISVHREHWERAIELYGRAVHLAEEVLGPKHPDTISYSCNLGYAYQGNGMLLEAEETCARALELSNEVLGDSHVTTLSSMANLASVRNELGYERPSIDLMEDCVQQCQKVLGSTHPIAGTYKQMLDEWEMAKDGFDACVVIDSIERGAET